LENNIHPQGKYKILKRVFFVFISLFTLQALSAQTLKWDSTFRPPGYQLKTEQFNSYNDKGDIIFLGNSITAGTDWSELLHMDHVRNRGISGDITFGILERLEEVYSGKPSKVFILIGINDISRNIPDSVILRNYKTIIERIKKGSPSTKIYFHTLLPVNNEFTPSKNQFNKDEHILFVNAELKKIAGSSGITLIDLYPHFLDGQNKLDKKYTVDGLHLNTVGYKVWAQILEKGGYLK
jgi:lysophospholipase L1-like esterase